MFFCAFIALRSADISRPMTSITDSNLRDEDTLFAGYETANHQGPQGLTINRSVIDDNYKHALRVLQDKDSKCVRLQASVLAGEMKR